MRQPIRVAAESAERTQPGGLFGRWGGMRFHVSDASFALIEELVPLLGRIRVRDRSLADQLVRAANSIALNVEEARGVELGNQRARFMTASGSAKETRAALRLAIGWRLISESEAAPALDLLDRILAMLWRLTKGRTTPTQIR